MNRAAYCVDGDIFAQGLVFFKLQLYNGSVSIFSINRYGLCPKWLVLHYSKNSVIHNGKVYYGEMNGFRYCNVCVPAAFYRPQHTLLTTLRRYSNACLFLLSYRDYYR
jgi:hypothetical protein